MFVLVFYRDLLPSIEVIWDSGSIVAINKADRTQYVQRYIQLLLTFTLFLS